MRKVTYLAIIQPTERGYRVTFPELPGCACVGPTLEDALRLAHEALAAHIYGLERAGAPLPLQRPPQPPPGAFLSPVAIFPDMVRRELDSRRVKTNVTLPYWLKSLAEQHGINFSKVLESALMDMIGQHRI